jgi:hypothetical protein
MLAADYHAKNLDDMIPTHLNRAQRQPLAFYSHKLTDAQTRYTVIELELLAIVETLQEYCTILLGHIIKIYTDHKNLTFAKFNTDRVRRW